MTRDCLILSGFGSVSPYGPVAGLAEGGPVEPTPIAGWQPAGLRRAFQVPQFRPAEVAPGIKIRRLDRLSVWSLAAAWLALKDSGIELGDADRSRIAVVSATGLGCAELTEAYLQSALDHGWAQTDPILFPDTLGNAPAAHVARQFELRGPNITIGSVGAPAQAAILTAASLLRHGQADLALVLAGDTLTRAVYEWYEVAGLLSSDCFGSGPATGCGGLIPSEGVAAALLERPGRARTGEPRRTVRLLDGRWTAPPAEWMEDRGVLAAPLFPAAAFPGDTGGLLRLILCLASTPAGGRVALGGAASLLLESSAP